MSQKALETLVKLLLPEEIFNYFDVTQIFQDDTVIRLYLEELNLPPGEYQCDKLISKGFLPESTIQDFPVRGKAFYLIVKRRKWLNETTGEIVTRNWDLVSEGTRMTKEFAAFLKEFSRHASH